MANEGSKRGIVERAIVLQSLRADHRDCWSHAELERELSDIAPLDISDALARLQTEGVVVLEGEQVRASGCARYLDALNLICI